jgi:hypothetical protein
MNAIAAFVSHVVRVALTVALLGLVSCGGGVELGGTGGTGSSIVGPVAGFGSIIVDGVRIEESAAEVRNSEGTVVARESIKLGMVVEVNAGAISDDGSGNRSAIAQTVRIRSELRGPIQSIELPAAPRITVLGQPVAITPTTVVEGGVNALAVAQVVEVHGAFDLAGQRFVATRIEPAAASSLSRVRGVATGVGASLPRLTIAGQTYDLSTTGLPAGLIEGSFVDLRVEPQPRNGLWVVTRVDVEDRRLPDREQAEVEGRVTAFTSAAQFQVDGVPVDASRASFEGPAVALGSRVKVRGASVAGVLQASLVRVRAGDGDGGSEAFDLRDVITSVDAASQTFVLRGVTVFYGAPTVEFRGGSAADLQPSRRVRVRGALDNSGQRVVASRIEFLAN